MHILLCHERFQARFGVDRLLLRCAAEFQAQGHQVTLAGQRFDDIAKSLGCTLVVVPSVEPYTLLDQHTATWLAGHWQELFASAPPDVAVSAGWPFFSALSLFAERGCRTIFCECGITPVEGLPEGTRRTLNLLAGLKKSYLPGADAIAPISDFLLESQIRTISPADQLIRTIRLSGAHALETPGTPGDVPRDAPDVLALGRFEAGNYKQSELAGPFAARLAERHPDIKVGVLATAEELAVLPAATRQQIVPLGHPDDATMRDLIRAARLTVVFSRWEGFNLPLAESVSLGTACLVFDVGAHREVVPDPWYLCANLDDMVAKADALLSRTAPDSIRSGTALAGYAARRTWGHVANEYLELIKTVMARPLHGFQARRTSVQRQDVWLIDVTNAARDTANSGVVRVCRRLAAELQKLVPVLFVVWDPQLKGLRFPYEAEFTQLGAYGGPVRPADHPASFPRQPLLLNHFFSPHAELNGWLIVPEIRHEPAFSLIRGEARAWGLKVAAVFYDAIPLLHPDLVADPVYREGHATYMVGLVECHIVLAISHRSAVDLQNFWRTRNFPSAAATPCLLPGNAAIRPVAGTVAMAPAHRILCVSTLEPRKGHRRLIAAFLAAADRTSTPWELVLVGNRYAGAMDIANEVEELGRRDPRVRWLGVISDEELAQEYARCAFTVFASEIEGFGLPVLESLWHGRPCLCHHESVMGELARDGGCLTADLADPAAFRDALVRLMSDEPLRATLQAEARARPIKTWGDYGREFLGHLLVSGRIHHYTPDLPSAPPPRWNDYLYPGCLTEHWRMNDSERIALRGLLAVAKPRVAIEIGTHHGGSLSLIRQHCAAVFSIDIDPAVQTHFSWMPNVSFLTGNSVEVLPPLLNALAAAALHPGLILVDGSRSSEGVRQDIECLLDFVPFEPCLVLMHDTANAACRAGQLAARWARSPYVHFVDLDYVPGRLVEHGGGANGEVWGGLGLALLLPAPRSRALEIGGSATRMIQLLQAQQA